MQKNKMLLGYILVIASAVIFGCMPLLSRLIYAEGVNSFTLVFMRNALSLPMLAAAAKLGGASLKVPLRTIPAIGAVATVGYCVTPILLYTSYISLDTGVATVFHFIYPAVVVLLGFIFLKNKLGAGNLVSLAVCIAGICMFYTPGAKIGAVGSVLALLSGVTYAIYVVGFTTFRDKNIPSFVFNLYGASFCAVISLAVCLVSGKLALPSSLKGWLFCVLFAFVFNVCAAILFQRGTLFIGGERASILSTFEPITGVAVGMAFLNETGGWRTAIGTVLVIAASVMIAVTDMKKKSEK